MSSPYGTLAPKDVDTNIFTIKYTNNYITLH